MEPIICASVAQLVEHLLGNGPFGLFIPPKMAQKTHNFAGMAQWESVALVRLREWVRFPLPAPQK